MSKTTDIASVIDALLRAAEGPSSVNVHIPKTATRRIVECAVLAGLDIQEFVKRAIVNGCLIAEAERKNGEAWTNEYVGDRQVVRKLAMTDIDKDNPAYKWEDWQ
jgi:hypothetical protein